MGEEWPDIGYVEYLSYQLDPFCTGGMGAMGLMLHYFAAKMEYQCSLNNLWSATSLSALEG